MLSAKGRVGLPHQLVEAGRRPAGARCLGDHVLGGDDGIGGGQEGVIGVFAGAVPDEMGDAANCPDEGAKCLWRGPPRGCDKERSAFVTRGLGKRCAEGGGEIWRKAEGRAVASEQHRERGRRRGSIFAAKLCAAAARRFGVTLCTAPKVLITFLPVQPSWSGAAIRCKEGQRLRRPRCLEPPCRPSRR